MDKKRLVVISGNGLSIACSNEFAPAKLTERLKDELRKSDALGKPQDKSQLDPETQAASDEESHPGLNAALSLASYLDGTYGADTDDLGFEQIVGAFDSLSRSVTLLSELLEAGAAVTTGWDKDHLKTVSSYFDAVYRRGTAAALKAIDAAAQTRANKSPIKRLVKLAVDNFGDEVTFATLSYDTLLLQVLMSQIPTGKFADLACGGKASPLSAEGGASVPAFKLTGDVSAPAFTSHPIHLLNLHGSVQYWERADGMDEPNVKIQANPDIRAGHLARYGAGEVDEGANLIRPLVIFGNQRDKSVLVNQPPFKVAYDRLTRDLDEARAVLVIGYSFADEALNQAIREHVTWNQDIRAVLVVTKGSDPTDAAVGSVFGACGVSPVILRCGADMAKVARTWEWNRFVEIAKPQDLTA